MANEIRLVQEDKLMTEKKNMINLQKALNTPRHQYEDTPYCDRGEKLHMAFRKYILKEEPLV